MAGQSDQEKPISLFYSYAHKDEDLRHKLETHLAALRRGGLIAEWHDRKIEPGDAWKDEIDRHLTSADIVLLLVSSDFIASDYCWGEEMAKALERHQRGEARVIPVILRHCRWRSTPLASLQAIPKDARPIKSWLDEDEAFDDVAAAIESAVQTARQRADEARRDQPKGFMRAWVQAEALHEERRKPRRSPAPATSKKPKAPSQRTLPIECKPGLIFRDINQPWCPELVVIPAGSFVMGSPDDEAERTSVEGPQHRVTLARPFALGRYPVTFEEYDHFCDQTERRRPHDKGWGRCRQPAIYVTWEDAQAYCIWLSQQTGQPYRLPSEAEWEYACRAGTTTPFWTGATVTTEQANYDGSFVYASGHKGESQTKTTPVDAFRSNPWGLHDMHGNVYEWVEDCWNDNYRGAPTDGSAWLEGDSSRRVLRGGSWFRYPGRLRSADRYDALTDQVSDSIGFRIARAVTP